MNNTENVLDSELRMYCRDLVRKSECIVALFGEN